jgi:hypothetical protein
MRFYEYTYIDHNWIQIPIMDFTTFQYKCTGCGDIKTFHYNSKIELPKHGCVKEKNVP